MTVRETARIVRTPTYTRTGLELILRQCKNPRCDYSEEQRAHACPSASGSTTSGGDAQAAERSGGRLVVR
jgi:hypothetical protein